MALVIIVVWNGYLYLQWNRTSGLSGGPWQPDAKDVGIVIDPNEPQLWQDIKKTLIEEDPEVGFRLQFDDSLMAIDGQEVELPGVGFLISSGLREDENGEDEVTEFLLLPGHGGVAWCCGLSPIAHHEFSVLVDCHDYPFSASGIDPKSPAFFVNVRGTMRLERDNTLNALYTLENVNLQFIDIESVLPADVMNLCQNRRMSPQDLLGLTNIKTPDSRGESAGGASP
ncbi:MAG: hypothetical protein AAFP90_12565 [Planctomycetota bacterium]